VDDVAAPALGQSNFLAGFLPLLFIVFSSYKLFQHNSVIRKFKRALT